MDAFTSEPVRKGPFIAQQKLAHLFGLPRGRFTSHRAYRRRLRRQARVVTEDLCVLATLKNRPAGQMGVHREEAFIGATTRHQMTTKGETRR